MLIDTRLRPEKTTSCLTCVAETGFILYDFYAKIAKIVLILAFFILFSMCFDLLFVHLQPEIILLERKVRHNLFLRLI